MIAPVAIVAGSFAQHIAAARQQALMTRLALALETSCPDLIEGAKNSERCQYCGSLVPYALVNFTNCGAPRVHNVAE